MTSLSPTLTRDAPVEETWSAERTPRAGSAGAPDATPAFGSPSAQNARVTVQTITDLAGLEANVRAWEALEAQALEPSPNLCRAWLAPALRHLGFPKGLEVVFIRREADGKPPELIGVFVLNAKRLHRGLPVGVARDWPHLFSFSGVPLVHRHFGQEAVTGLLEYTESRGLRALMLSGLYAHGAFADLLRHTMQITGGRFAELNSYERAAFEVAADVETYLRERLSRKRRKEFKRLRARLQEHGDVRLERFEKGDDIQPWLQEFYGLEMAGWKGRTGTAIGCREDWRGFFDEAIGDKAAGGEALFWRLMCDGKPAAMLFATMREGKVWLCKIAYDEELARFSPGALIIFDVMEDVCARGDVEMVDSCALPDHPMIEHIWRDRVTVQDVMVASGQTSSRLFDFLAAHERKGRAARAFAKRIYLKLKSSFAGGKS